jgi:outer membrane protein
MIFFLVTKNLTAAQRRRGSATGPAGSLAVPRKDNPMDFMKMMGLLAFLVAAGSTANAAAEDMKIGTVDMQKALQSVEAGKKAKSQLEKEFTSKKKELQDEESSIKKMGEEFKKQSLVMSDEARAKKQSELQERIMKLQENSGRSQMELAKKERDLTQPIILKLKTIVTDMAKTKGYTMVLEKNENTVLFSQDKDDLTNDVISTFNKQFKDKAPSEG